MIAKAHYNSTVLLAQGWEENPTESLTAFLSEVERKLITLMDMAQSEFIKVDNLAINFSAVVSERDDQKEEDLFAESDESLSTDFWLEVAKGNFTS